MAAPVPCGETGYCLLKADVFWPQGRTNLPVVVMVPGGPLPLGIRETVWPLARYVAARGATVFVADYRARVVDGAGYPATFSDVACAVATARDRAAEFGGDGRHVVLVSHSFGGFPAAVVATAAEPPTLPECFAAAAPRRPDAFVGVAGVYLPSHIGPELVASYATSTGNEPASEVKLLAMDAAARMTESPPVPVTLVVASNDAVAPIGRAEDLAAALEEAQYPVSIVVVPNADHESVLSAPATVDAVIAATGR